MYTYLGDRHTDPRLRKQICSAVRNEKGKCIRGKGNMLVEFDGVKTVVVARLLRKVE